MPTYNSFSTHAPTGQSQKFVVSPNQYSDAGRNIGYPTKYSVYVNKLSDIDGSQLVTENRELSELVGSRLYLWHRPLTNSGGAATTISVIGGGSPVIDTNATNTKSAYIVFSTLPTSSFAIRYVAVADCINAWNVNTLQDDVMEMQQSLGVSTLTGNPGLRNLAYGLFDIPNDANLSGVVSRAVYLSHLARDIVIGSTTDPTLAISLGDSHTIQIGTSNDAILVNTTGFHVVQSAALETTNITLGIRTGDNITFMGAMSGAGQVTIGGPGWSNLGDVDWASRGYSGVVFTSGLTGSFYSGSMLRVHGDVSVAGQLRTMGSITVVTTTGETSTVLGDWTVQDELFVYGNTHLNGITETNQLNVRYDLFVDGNIIANNLVGTGGLGQTLVDNLDCSEIAHNYTTVTKKRINNCVIEGSHTISQLSPKLSVYAPHYLLTNSGLVGDVFTIRGSAGVGFRQSGAHPAVMELNATMSVTHDTFTGVISWSGSREAKLEQVGPYTGVFSPGMFEPGKMWVRFLEGNYKNLKAPVYGYDIKEAETLAGSPHVLKIRVFCPDSDAWSVGSGPCGVLLYNPGSIPYNYVGAAGGASPTFFVSGSTDFPLKIAFDDEVRIMTSSTTNLSLQSALEFSVSGMTTTVPTGVAYIYASSYLTDPENAPSFKARPFPHRMPNETAMGEVVASLAGGVWSILETTSYRPNGEYDSSWIPIVSGCALGLNSGRLIPALNAASNTSYKFYFQHQLGPVSDMAHINADLFLSAPPTYPYEFTGSLEGFNETHTDVTSFHGQDHATSFGPQGRFLRLPLFTAKSSTNPAGLKDARVFYMDSRVVGVEMTPSLLYDIPTGYLVSNWKGQPYKYLRLTMRRDV